MHQAWIIESWEKEHVYTHIRVTHLRFLNFELSYCHQIVQVAFWVVVAPFLLQVHLFLCTSCASPGSVLYYFVKESSRPRDCHEPLPGVFLSQPSPLYAQETQLPASFLLGLQRKVSWQDIAFSLLLCKKTLLWSFWPYSRQGACWTVLAIPDLLALP